MKFWKRKTITIRCNKCNEIVIDIKGKIKSNGYLDIHLALHDMVCTHQKYYKSWERK